jgi:hypothetical protein
VSLLGIFLALTLNRLFLSLTQTLDGSAVKFVGIKKNEEFYANK